MKARWVARGYTVHAMGAGHSGKRQASVWVPCPRRSLSLAGSKWAKHTSSLNLTSRTARCTDAGGLAPNAPEAEPKWFQETDPMQLPAYYTSTT